VVEKHISVFLIKTFTGALLSVDTLWDNNETILELLFAAYKLDAC